MKVRVILRGEDGREIIGWIIVTNTAYGFVSREEVVDAIGEVARMVGENICIPTPEEVMHGVDPSNYASEMCFEIARSIANDVRSILKV